MSDPQSHSDEHRRFFKKTQIPYSRSKEDVWKDMMVQIQNHQKPAKKTNTFHWHLAAAAAVVLLIGLTAFLRFYSATLYAPPGQHLTKTLPQGSTIHLNAGTKLSYHPYWWRFARILTLEGEAYFEIEKGNRLTVQSTQGNTRVLGTRFNIYARNDKYRVHCLSGQVQVNTASGKSRILHPNQALSATEKGEMQYQANVKSQHAIAWTQNRFVFTAVSLKEVFREMERQFDITIEIAGGIEGKYTGNFQRGSSPKNILEMIARPFGLEVQQIHQTKYKITTDGD